MTKTATNVRLTKVPNEFKDIQEVQKYLAEILRQLEIILSQLSQGQP